ncbi:MAG TPA: hypothetical protein VFV57_09615 [Limnobacter sp.]|nr:hypothetical protein [Limnobacter sp.]
MGLTNKGTAVLRNLKSAAKARASTLPSAPLLNAVAEQVNQLEHGIKNRVDGMQEKVKNLQNNLTKIYQANRELEQQNAELSKQLVQLEKENTQLNMALERSEMEGSLMQAKLDNIRKLIESLEEPKPARRAAPVKPKAKGKRA